METNFHLRLGIGLSLTNGEIAKITTTKDENERGEILLNAMKRGVSLDAESYIPQPWMEEDDIKAITDLEVRFDSSKQYKLIS